MKNHFSIKCIRCPLIFISEYNHTYHTHTSCYYCLGLTLCYMQQIVTQIYLLCFFIWLILFSSTFAILHFLGADTVTDIIYVDSNSHNLWATLKWSFYVSFCPPSAHPSDHKKLILTLWCPTSNLGPIQWGQSYTMFKL